MNTSKIIKAYIGAGTYSVTEPITQWDYGYILQIEGAVLPSVYRVDFSNNRHEGEALTVYGNEDGAEVPEELIATGKDIFAFYYYIGEGFGKTAYTWKIPNDTRANAGDREPTPTQQDSIDQLIVRSNEAVTSAEQSASAAGQSAQSASDDADRAERARTAAETAQGKAEDAQESAERAKDDAETSERNASESERKAKGYAETASEKADAITGLTAQATTLPDGSSATASYNAETGVMSFGIPKGKDGTDGDDGYSPTANVSKTGKTATITITDKNGTTSAQVEDGTDGIDGISPSVSVTDITGGHRVVITDKDGAKSFDVEDGATGATPNLTIGTVETLEPTDDATATITGTPENPVLNLGIPQGDTGEVTLADLNSALIEKAPIITDTASGAIASFSDGADNLPLKSLVVDIDPVQDLHGQANPYPAGGGKNLVNVVSPQTITSQTELARFLTSEKTTYTLSATIVNNASVNGALNIYLFNGNSYVAYKQVAIPANVPSARYSVSMDTSEYTFDQIRAVITGASVGYSLTVSNVQLEKSAAATAFAPYENICPISGWTSVDVQRTGVNIWDEEWEVGGISSADGSKYNDNNRIRSKNFIPVKPSTQYYFTMPSTLNAFKVAFYGLTKDFLSFNTYKNNVITTPSNCYWLMLSENGTDYGTTYNHDISINYPSTDHAYHPYTGRSITINLGQTVYGGHLDVLSGVLTVDMAMVDLGTLTWNYVASSSFNFRASELIGAKPPANAVVKPNAICSILPVLDYTAISAPVDGITIIFATSAQAGKVWAHSGTYTDATAFKSAVTGQTLVYELAEPIEIQLTPNQINSLYGVNNLWADSGDTTAEYRADTKLFIERLTAPDSADMIADANITSGKYFMVGNSLYKATANIANGSAIIVGTNAVRKSLSEALNEINA